MNDTIPHILEQLAQLPKGTGGPSVQTALELEAELQRAFCNLLRNPSIHMNSLPQNYREHPIFQTARYQVITELQREGVLIEELPVIGLTPALQQRMRIVETQLRTLMEKPPHTDSHGKKKYVSTGITRPHALGLPDCHSISILLRENPSLKEKLQQATGGEDLETLIEHGDGLGIEHLTQKKNMVYREYHLFDRWGETPIALSIAIRKAGMVPKWLYAQSKVDPSVSLDRWFGIQLRATALANVNETLFEYSMGNGRDELQLPSTARTGVSYTFLPNNIGEAVLDRDSSFPDPTTFGKSWSQAWFARMFLCNAFREALLRINLAGDLRHLIRTGDIGWLAEEWKNNAFIDPFYPRSPSIHSIAAGFRGKSRKE